MAGIIAFTPRTFAVLALLVACATAAAEPRIQLKRKAVAGRVDVRPGNVVIGPNWVGGGHCEGTTLPGVQVFYVPTAGFTGTDRFSFDVGYSGAKVVRAEVEVVVR